MRISDESAKLLEDKPEVKQRIVAAREAGGTFLDLSNLGLTMQDLVHLEPIRKKQLPNLEKVNISGNNFNTPGFDGILELNENTLLDAFVKQSYGAMLSSAANKKKEENNNSKIHESIIDFVNKPESIISSEIKPKPDLINNEIIEIFKNVEGDNKKFNLAIINPQNQESNLKGAQKRKSLEVKQVRFKF